MEPAAAPEAGADAAEEDDASRQLELAMEEKEKGAELYKQQRFGEAREMWAQALGRMRIAQGDALGRLELSLRLNLSQASLQLKDFKDVIKHADEVLRLDPESAKGLYRRALAHDSLGNVKAAASDLQRSARLEPRNAEIRKKYEELKQKLAKLQELEEAEHVPPVHNLDTLPRAYLDVAVGDAAPERLVFALYSDTVPRTAENFRQLCAGEHAGTTFRGRPFHYKGSVLHRMIPGLMIQGGDFENCNGTGGESVYGRRFADESFADRHSRRGLLAMANDGPNTNGSNFFVSFAPAEHLDKHHVVFGEVVEGLEFLDQLEKLPTDAECRPLSDCVVVDCGELKADR